MSRVFFLAGEGKGGGGLRELKAMSHHLTEVKESLLTILMIMRFSITYGSSAMLDQDDECEFQGF